MDWRLESPEYAVSFMTKSVGANIQTRWTNI